MTARNTNEIWIAQFAFRYSTAGTGQPVLLWEIVGFLSDEPKVVKDIRIPMNRWNRDDVCKLYCCLFLFRLS